MAFQIEILAKEPVKDRRTRGAGLVIVGLAVLGSALYYLMDYRVDVFVVTPNTPLTDWPSGVAAVALLGVILLGIAIIAAGVRVYRPSAAEGLIASGVAVTLIGVLEYWWDEMLITGDGYPNVNWAFTIPVTAVGIILISAGISVRRRRS